VMGSRVSWPAEGIEGIDGVSQRGRGALVSFVDISRGSATGPLLDVSFCTKKTQSIHKQSDFNENNAMPTTHWIQQ
jgi:hypothetical protein